MDVVNLSLWEVMCRLSLGLIRVGCTGMFVCILTLADKFHFCFPS
jgi:hypothetical protein